MNMKIKVYKQDGQESGTFELPESVFGCDVNEQLLYAVLKSYRANRRQGTAKTKSRTEVSGGTSKPWRQKGTGRARSGRNTSPVWVRGGKAHGSNPRDYSTTIPKKMRKVALRSALSACAQESRITLVDGVECDRPKTASIAALLNALPIEKGKKLLVIDNGEKNIYLSGRNIRDVEIVSVEDINALNVISNNTIIFSNTDLIAKLEKVAAA
jgi:large subunit ribosomal protein L4